MRNKKKNFLAALMSLVLFSGAALVTSTYAFWNVLTYTQNETILVGEGVKIKVDAVAVAPEGKALVPVGKVVDSSKQVDSIVLSYNVRLAGATVGNLGLSVEISDIKIGGATTYADYANVVLSTLPTEVSNTNVLVGVTITLDEPSTEEIYNAIKNQPITFSLVFTALAI